MSKHQSRGGWQIVVGVLLLMFATMGGYVGGYFALGRLEESLWYRVVPNETPRYFRVFRYRWQAIIYSPAVLVESKVRGDQVQAYPRR